MKTIDVDFSVNNNRDFMFVHGGEERFAYAMPEPEETNVTNEPTIPDSMIQLQRDVEQLAMQWIQNHGEDVSYTFKFSLTKDE